MNASGRTVALSLSFAALVFSAAAWAQSPGDLHAGLNPGTGADSRVLAVARHADGRLIVGGQFTVFNGLSRRRLTQLNYDGSTDLSFDPGTAADGTMQAVAVQPDGKVLLAGGFSVVNGVARSRVARLNADGTLDTGFDPGAGPNAYVLSLVLQPDGRVLLGGYFWQVNGVARNRVARLNADGSVDTGFVPGTLDNGYVNSVVLGQDGKIILCGGLYVGLNSRILRLHANGAVDTTFNAGNNVINSDVTTAVTQEDGKVVIGGYFTAINGVSRPYLARLDVNGSLDPAFNPGAGANNYVWTILMEPDGALVAGGAFTTYQGVSRNRLTRVHNSAPINQPPLLDAIGNVTVAEDSGSFIVNLTGIAPGPITELGQTVTNVTATSSATAIVPNPVVAYTPGGTTATLTLTPVANANGVVTVSVTARDDGLSSATVTRTFTVTVTPVNDAPSFALNTSGFVVVGTVAGGGATAYSVGTGGYGQLAAGPSITSSTTPRTILNVTNFAQVSAGDYSSVALHADGTVWVWGRNDGGQLANGVVADGPANASFVPLQVAGLSGVTKVDAGFSWNLALKADGTVWAWGHNTLGQMGQGTNGSPLTTPTQVPGLTDVVDIVASGQHATVLKADGTVWTWGWNGNGELGRGTTGVAHPTPGQVTGVGGPVSKLFQKIFATTFVQKADGTIWAWGVGDNGQFGDGTSGGGRLTVNTPFQVTNLGTNEVQAIMASVGYTLALMTNGTVKAFGYNNDGQLGLGFGGAIQTTPVTIPTLSNIVAISAAQGAIALDASGQVWGWFQNGSAQNTSTPTVIPGLSNITQISSGQNFFHALGTPAAPLTGLGLNEDAGPQSVALFATSILAGPANESGQSVTFTVTNDNNALFSVQPAVAANGTLTFTPAANAFGLANIGVIAVDNGGAPGVSNSAAQTFTIAITNVNDAPAITFATNNLVVLEDAGAQSLGGFLSLSAGPFGEPGTVALFSVENYNTALFSDQPNLSGSTLTFTPAADANGTATVTVIAQDDTGLFSTNSFTVTVLPVNDAPSLTLTNLAITVVTNSAYSASLGANVVLGPANESGQTPATFVITNDNNALFSVQPSANSAGTLSFTAASGQLGTATLFVRVQDAGGTANGGVNVSAPVLVTVTVTPGNSVPTFSLATNALAVLEDSGAFTGGGFLTALSPGSQPFEAGQVVAVTTVNNNSNLFSAQPVISGGTLSFTPAANAFGSATVTITATDNGMPNLSSSQTVTITVTAVNDAPSFALNGGLTGWTTKAAMLGGGVNAAAGGVINGVWYVAGGGPPAGSTTNGLQAYDPVANTWTTRTSAGVSRGAAAAGVIANKLYVAGGALSLDYNTPTLALEIYDPVTDSWTGGAAMSVPRGGAASAVIGGKLYVAGGQGGFPYHAVSALEIYDPISNTWTSGAPLPTAVGNAVGAAINGKFYVAGGTTGPANVALLQIYDPVSNTWTSGTPLSGPRGYASGGVINGKLVVVGGLNASNTLTPTVEVYDPVSDTWTTGTPEPLPRSFAVAAVINSKLHVAGGSSTDTLEVYVPAVTVAEDAGAQAFAAFATGISVGPANESAQSLTFITSNTASNLFSSQPVLTFAGTLSFTPAANANGSATVSVYAQDNGGTANGGVNVTAVQTFTIVISPVNDAPSATFATNNVVVLEDSGPAGFAGFATFFLPADEAGQSITNVVTTNSNNALFSVQPSIGLDGALTFTPAPNAFGSAVVSVIATDNGGTANGGQSTSAPATFTLTVTGVNDAPTFTVLSNLVAVLEDSGAQTVPTAVTNISAGPGESQSVGFVTSNTASNLFTGSGQPVIAANGTLTFTPAPNANGSATVFITATDSGGTANGGVNTSAPQSLVIQIVNINDPPIVTFATNNLVRLEDSGAASVPAFAAFSAPADELAQVLLGYTVSNSSNALFSVQPSLALDGTLTFVPAANAHGVATVTVIAQDNGGTANGGSDTSTNTFTLTLTGVNDAPTLALPFSYVYVATNSGGFTTNLAPITSPGPNEAGQFIQGYTVTNSHPAFFTVQPYMSANGDFNFTLANGVSGIVTLTIRAHDSGGTANGGVDLSAPVTFTIFVGVFNVAPTFTFATNNVVVLEDGGAQTLAGQVANITAGETGLGQNVSLTTGNNNPALFSVQPSIAADGTLTFTPAANAFGSATVTVIATDDGLPALSTTQTFTITVTPVNDAPSFALPAGSVSPAGATWTARESNRNWYSLASSSDGSKLVAGVNGGQIYTSTDSGATWTARESSRNWYSLASSSDGSKLVAVPRGGQIYTSTDSGATWTARENSRNWQSVASSSDGSKLVAVDNGGQIYTSTDSGATWTARASNRGWTAVASSADGSKLVAAANFDQIYTSADSGATWTAREAGRNWYSLASSSDGSRLVAVVYGGQIYTSADSGATWTARESNRNWYSVASSSDGSRLVATVQNGMIYTSTDTGVTWTARESNRGWVPVASSADGGKLVAAEYGGQIYTSVGSASPYVLTVNEDTGTYTGGASFATGISAGPANESAQTLTFVVTNTNPERFSVQPAIDAAGTLTFTPATNRAGSATVTVYLQDNGGTDNGGVDLAGPLTFTISLTQVNDPPTIAFATNNVVVLEDSGAFSGGFATFATPPTNEGGQSVTNVVTSNSNSNLFSVQPTVTTGGVLSFTPAANSNGTATVTVIAQDSGGTDNGGVNLATNTFTITVTAVNDAPSFALAVGSGAPTGTTVINDQFDNGNPASNPTGTGNGFVSYGQVGGTESGGFLNLTPGSGASTMVYASATANAVNPFQATATSVTYTFGSITRNTDHQRFWIGYRVSGNGNNHFYPNTGVQGLYLSVNSYNQAEDGFTDQGNLIAVSSSGVNTTLASWTWSNPDQLSGLVVTLTTTASTYEMQFSGAAGGTPTFTVGAASGALTGLGTISGNFDTAVHNQYWFTAPGAVLLDSVVLQTGVVAAPTGITVAEDAGPQTTLLFATNIVAGPADESAQVVGFVVTNNNNALFSSQPAIGTNGALTFTSAPNANGTATVTVYAQDDGGILNGGVDIAGPQTFTITVTPVNDAPSAIFAFNPLEVMKNSPATNIAGFAAFLRGAADESGQSITNVIVSNDNNALFEVGGQPALSLARELSFQPAAGAVGTATVTVITEDDGGTANGGVNRGTNTFVIRVVSTKIYVVNAAPVAAGNAVTVPVSMLADGDENAVGFTLEFDPTLLTYTGVTADSGLALVANASQVAAGRLGIVLSKATGGAFSAGYNALIEVGFNVANVGTNGGTPVTFSSAVAYQQVTDASANNIPYVAYTAGRVLFTALATGIEGDVTPRPTGNGSVTVSDAVQVGRFAAGLDTITNFGAGSEFQRADSAPLGTQGDGRVTVADWVQAMRFAAGLDTPGAAGGPTVLATSVRTAALPAGGRVVRVVGGNLVAGQANTVTVQVDAQGNEAGLSLSLAFDPTALAFVSANVGSGATGGSLMFNSVKAAAGKVGLVLVLPAGSTLAAGPRDVVTLTFNVTGSGATAISVSGDSPVAREVADVNANVLGASYVNGSFNIILPVGLKAAGVERGVDGSLRLVVRNSDGTPITAAQAARYEVQVTSNLGGAWTVLPNALVVENGALKIVDPAAGSAGLRLYKLVERP
jgi:uncharacterized delta-60 repeat protein